MERVGKREKMVERLGDLGLAVKAQMEAVGAKHAVYGCVDIAGVSHFVLSADKAMFFITQKAFNQYCNYAYKEDNIQFIYSIHRK